MGSGNVYQGVMDVSRGLEQNAARVGGQRGRREVSPEKGSDK